MLALENRIFRASMGFSVLLHAFLLVGIVLAQTHYVNNIPRRVEVVYKPSPEKVKPPTRKREELRPLKAPSTQADADLLALKDTGMIKVEKSFDKTPMPFLGEKKEPVSFAGAGTKKFVSVPLLTSEKISSPQYMNYHDRIREKIKNRAYFFADHPDFQEGEVYLTFVLKSNGQLKEVKIIEEKTRANDFLRSVGVRSIKESSPFAPFPADLRYPELSFNVVISFKVEE